MKYFKDGNQLCVTEDNFVNLQESPVVFYPLESEIAKTILVGGIGALSLGDLTTLRNRLKEV